MVDCVDVLIIAAVSFLFDIATGPAMTDTLPVGEVVNVLLGKPEVDEMNRLIVMDLRLPIAVMALVVGAALGVGGAEIQTLLNNPMASPYTLGLAAAAGLGASAVIAFGGFGLPETVAVPIGAFVMTMLASGILFLFASARRFNSAMLVLVGIALLFLFQSILSLIQFIAAPEISQQILFWLFGSLTKATWETVIVTAAVTAVCVFLLSHDVWKLTALRLGEERAVGLGINLQFFAPENAGVGGGDDGDGDQFRRRDRLYRLGRAACGADSFGRRPTFFPARRDAGRGGVFIGRQRVVQGDYPWRAVSGGDCYVVCRRAVLLLDCINETIGRLKC